MHAVAIHLAGPPSEAVLEELLDLLASMNCLWFLERWSKGQRPPRSAAEAGVVWTPDSPSTSAVFEAAPVVFQQGAASCGPIAAIKVGHARAVERIAGRSPEAVRQRHRVELVKQRPRYWHAMHRSPWGLHNPTEGMVTP
ncbi:MAG: hypothetical protein K0V04_16110 [Deltaproteobacteria bacterium]|nr:hypothetical protein [Deltaproteobacteria bacterium]